MLPLPPVAQLEVAEYPQLLGGSMFSCAGGLGTVPQGGREGGVGWTPGAMWCLGNGGSWGAC